MKLSIKMVRVSIYRKSHVLNKQFLAGALIFEPEISFKLFVIEISALIRVKGEAFHQYFSVHVQRNDRTALAYHTAQPVDQPFVILVPQGIRVRDRYAVEHYAGIGTFS